MMNSICRLHTSLGLLLLALLAVPALRAADWPVRVLDSWQAGLQFPTDLAVDEQGRAWVVDGLNRRLLVIDPENASTREVTHPRFRHLLGICISGNKVLLTDTGTRSIYRLDLQGTLREETALPEDCDPVDLQVVEGRLAVSDNDNHRILLLDAEGRVERTVGKGFRTFDPRPIPAELNLPIGETGQLAGEFSYPGILGVFDRGFLVVDVLGGRVQTFSPRGNFTRAFGSFSADGQGLYRPKGACWLPGSGDVLVTDGYVGWIVVYDSWGTRQGVLTQDGKAWRLTGPTAIATAPRPPAEAQSPDKSLIGWVVDGRASTVHRFAMTRIEEKKR